ncbi:Maf family protein [Neisseriaceae bacterium ESL0693]|nr:Maf family protein [Neisseriaceae bacterium ESL0693]
MDTQTKLILGSSSVFRQQQLARLLLPFEVARPQFDETPLAGETAEHTALRLAEGKARSLAGRFADALIIGADQVALCQGRQLGKPLDVVKAQQMLHDLSGRQIMFYSALVLFNPRANRIHRHVDHTCVTMRTFSDDTIHQYLLREPDAIYCAGAAKSEGLGMCLIERIDSTDPNALIGLPMLRLIDFLLAEGVPLL